MTNTSMTPQAQPGTDMTNKATPIPKDQKTISEIHETLSSARRRHVMRTLFNVGSLEKKELAKYVAALENEKPLDELTGKEHKRVVVSLHQVHLDYLSKRGYVVWDKSTNMVALGQRSDHILRYIDGIPIDEGDDRPRGVVDRVAAIF